jgi:hypothetical protein
MPDSGVNPELFVVTETKLCGGTDFEKRRNYPAAQNAPRPKEHLPAISWKLSTYDISSSPWPSLQSTRFSRGILGETPGDFFD